MSLQNSEGSTSGTTCLVLPLLQMCTREELCTSGSALNEIFLKMITRCKCPEHITENPVELPTVGDLYKQLIATVSELLDWGIDHMREDTSGNSWNLVVFIKDQCTAESPTSLFTIMDNLERIYTPEQNDQ